MAQTATVNIVYSNDTNSFINVDPNRSQNIDQETHGATCTDQRLAPMAPRGVGLQPGETFESLLEIDLSSIPSGDLPDGFESGDTSIWSSTVQN